MCPFSPDREPARNLSLLLAYDGTAYAGWQRQKNALSIQAVLEGALRVMTGARTVVSGAGRTDAGVHALGMVANFLTRARIPCEGFLRGLNSILPEDVRVLRCQEEQADFHARYSARGKAYFYNFTEEAVLLPTDRLYWAKFRGALDLDAMRAGLGHLIGRKDFSCFEAAGSRDREESGPEGAVRTIFAARIEAMSGHAGRHRLHVSGDGFLRHMVRNIVGTLVEVGQGRRSAASLPDLLAAGDRSQAGPTAPACGLFLHEVYYGSGAMPHEPMTNGPDHGRTKD